MKAYLRVFARDEKGNLVMGAPYGLRPKVAYVHELEAERISWVKPTRDGRLNVGYSGGSLDFDGDELGFSNY